MATAPLPKFDPKKLIGHATCPECSQTAEVKTDKSGNPYRWCPDVTCNAQYFTRGHPDRVRRLLAVTTLLDAPKPAPGPVPSPTASPPAAPPKPASPFRTLLHKTS